MILHESGRSFAALRMTERLGRMTRRLGRMAGGLEKGQ
jgi:hypothetical protein